MNLLYLTHKFPFDSGDGFPNLEIKYLAKFFKNILIVPINEVKANESIKFDLPQNVKATTRVSEFMYASLQKPHAVRKLFFNQPSFYFIQQYFQSPRAYRSSVVCTWALSTALTNSLCHCVNLADYDVFYSFWLDYGAHALMNCKKKYPNKIFLSRAHGFDLYSEVHGLRDLPFQKQILSGLDHIYPCSKYGENYLIRKFPNLRKKISARYLGIEKPEVLTKSSTDHKLKIVSCGHLIPLKRVDRIAQALKLVRRPVQWSHFGDGPEKPKLMNEVNQLPSHIAFTFYGRQPREEILKFYKNQPVDLFVHVSISEGIPVSIMEAMAYGIPCCATNVGGVSEIVNKNTGYVLLCDFSDQQLASIIENHDLKSSIMRVQACQTFENKFQAQINFESFGQELVQWIKSMSAIPGSRI